MLTWLDYYTSGASSNLPGLDDREAMLALAIQGQDPIPEDLTRAPLMQSIIPFLLPREDPNTPTIWKNPRAMRLNSSLVADFMSAGAVSTVALLEVPRLSTVRVVHL